MLVVFFDGNTLKLRGPPKGFTPKPVYSKEAGGQVNSLGYGKNVSHVTMGNPQPSPYSLFMVWGRFRDLMGVGPFLMGLR
jgi:hypothetical protein